MEQEPINKQDNDPRLIKVVNNLYLVTFKCNK